MQPPIMEIMKNAAKAAGEKVRAGFWDREHVKIELKGKHFDLVTRIDLESQKIIQDMISEQVPRAGFVGEEALNSGGDELFIIDPIDGTTNFATGVDFFCISIGHVKDGQLKTGVVYDPMRETWYTAEKEKGAWVEKQGGRKRLGMEFKELDKCTVSAHLNMQTLPELVKCYEQLLPHTRGGRALGSITLELCYAAEGIVDIAVNGNCFQWDVAAATLIINEAGGRVMDWQGRDIVFLPEKSREPYKIVACHRDLADKILGFFPRD